MRWFSGVCGWVLLIAACSDDGVETAESTGSQTDAATDASTGPGGESTSASTSQSDPTTTTTGTPTTTEATDTGETSVGSTGVATDTGSSDDTGPVLCVPPMDVPVADVPLNDACAVPLQMDGFDPVVEWKYGNTPFFGPPVVGPAIDTNDSGQLDAGDRPLVFLYENLGVTALWGDGSGVAWTRAGLYGQYGGLALGDLDGDGWNEIVTVNTTMVCALDGRDGAERWCASPPTTSLDPMGFAYPSIADMDSDGLAEVVVGNAIFDAEGGILGIGAEGKGSANQQYAALSVVVDLDADGVLEVVTGNAAYDLDGNTLWMNGLHDGLPAVADFDLDGAGEIVKTIGTGVVGMESDGTVLWGPLPFPGNLGAPAVDDLDGDGTPDIVFGTQGNLVAMQWGGAVLWQAAIADDNGAAGPVLFDFEGDGYPEVLFADKLAIRVFSGLDGSSKYLSMEHASQTALETPIVADVDADGHVEIVLGNGSGNAQVGAIAVFGDASDTWPPGRKIWNQHAYHITNTVRLA